MASILWSYLTQTNTEKEKYEKLLHFFEATLEFLTVIHLSAYQENDELWSLVQPGIKEQLDNNNLRIEMATFGAWLTIFELLMKRSREKLQLKDEGSREQIMSMYKISDFNLLMQFFDKSYLGIFKESVSIRNKWLGHVGAVSEQKASEIHFELNHLLSRLRGLFVGIWDQYILVIPEGSDFVNGMYEYSTRSIMGTRTPFGRIDVSVKKGMEKDKLHLVSKDTGEFIELIPFVQVKPSPKTESDACYFYNRLEDGSGDARYISYHYEGDPEHVMSNESLMLAIDKINKV